MHYEQLQKDALKAACKAWGNLAPAYNWNPEAFEESVRAYFHVLANPLTDRKMPPPKADRPAQRSVKEHFLAMSTGHYMGYMMTLGRTGSVERDVICFQPDQKSSILQPLFMSVHPVHDALTDEQGRKFDVEIVDKAV